MNFVNNIGYYLSWTALVVVSLFIISNAIPLNFVPKMYTVLSGSMEPAIKTGSIVTVLKSAHYSEGDIVTFVASQRDAIPTTHRIISVRAVDGKMRFTTKGDANDDMDIGELQEKQILGKVIFSIPSLGYLASFAKTGWGFFLLLVVPCLLIMQEELVKVFSFFKKKQSDTTSPE